MTLAQLIDEFVKLYPEYGDPVTAWGRCDEATYRFMRLAMERGYKDGLTTYTFWANDKYSYRDEGNQENPEPDIYNIIGLDGYILKNDVGVTMCTWHCIVDAGHILIDFTARQYRSHYAFPHIIAVEEKAFAAKAGM